MGSPIFFLLLSLAFSFPLSSVLITISKGTSISVEKPYILISPNGDFSASFYSMGDHAFCFTIWFSNTRTVVWMANRDQPVHGRHSKLSLLKNGNLILTDANKLNVWTTNTVSLSFVQLFLHNTGNLVLCNVDTVILWQSCDFPTDTLLPQQLLTRNTKLVSSRSQSNYSIGFFEFFFKNQNILRLFYNYSEISKVGRISHNNSKTVVLNALGKFSSSDDLTFVSADYGVEEQSWVVSWQAIQKPCEIPGACGANGLCSYVIGFGKKSSRPLGYKMKNHSDWADDCELEVDLSCKANESRFLQLSQLSHVDFYSYYGNDFGNFLNYTFDQCRDLLIRTGQKFMLWFAYGVGGLEIISFFLVWCLFIKTQKSLGVDKQAYDRAAIRFRKFTYTELKKATKSFSEEIGRGEGGIVYKGVLSDNRVAAIKLLKEASQGEGEFLAEITIIGRIKHMNLIEIWGYCAEGKHRLLVYEYMKFKIVVGTAKGLAYLHEDCLDWILHCYLKLQNILLDSTYQPKVADFGLSKLQNREWVFNLPITSKVDVYSYGIVVLEIMIGKGPSRIDDGGEAKHKRLVTWVREKMKKAAANTSFLEEIIDPMLAEEDKDERPTMSLVVEMVLRQEKVSDAVIFDECSDECSLMANFI
ncbi:hypothetical protein ACJW30_01G020600 [Castanea mollissima]